MPSASIRQAVAHLDRVRSRSGSGALRTDATSHGLAPRKRSWAGWLRTSASESWQFWLRLANPFLGAGPIPLGSFCFLIGVVLLIFAVLWILSPSGTWNGLWFLCAAAVFLTCSYLRHAPTADPRRRCRSCRYDLSATPDAATLHCSDGPRVGLGPQRCPECGARWPLVGATLDPDRVRNLTTG